jgi:hypothetical protein
MYVTLTGTTVYVTLTGYVSTEAEKRFTVSCPSYSIVRSWLSREIWLNVADPIALSI